MGIQLGGFAGESGPSEAVEFVGKRRFDGLAAIPESLLGDEFVDLLKQFCVSGQRDFGVWHGGMIKYHTTWDAVNKALQPAALGRIVKRRGSRLGGLLLDLARQSGGASRRSYNRAVLPDLHLLVRVVGGGDPLSDLRPTAGVVSNAARPRRRRYHADAPGRLSNKLCSRRRPASE